MIGSCFCVAVGYTSVKRYSLKCKTAPLFSETAKWLNISYLIQIHPNKKIRISHCTNVGSFFHHTFFEEIPASFRICLISARRSSANAFASPHFPSSGKVFKALYFVFF